MRRIRSLFIFSLLSLLVLPLPYASENYPADPHELFYHGIYLEFGIGDLRGALDVYSMIIDEPLLAKSDLAGNTLVRKGDCYSKLGEDERAAECYDRAIDEFPGSAVILESAFIGKEKLSSRAKPEDKEKKLASLIREGKRNLQEGFLEEAKDKIRQALNYDLHNPELQRFMASICATLGDHAEAEHYYRKAVSSRAYSTNFAVYKEWIDCQLKMGNVAEAIKSWRRYLDLPVLNEDDEANAEAELKKLETDYSLRRQLAESHVQRGDLDEAIKSWSSYTAHDLVDEHDRKMAGFEAWLIQVLHEYPKGKPPPWTLMDSLEKGKKLMMEKNYAGALRTYNTARIKYRQSYLPLLWMGYTCEHFSLDLEEAIRHYELALKQAPLSTAQRLRCRLAELYERRGNLKMAAYHMEHYFQGDVRPVINDNETRARIMKKIRRGRSTKAELK